MNSDADNTLIASRGLSHFWVRAAAVLVVAIGGFWLVAWLIGVAGEWSGQMITPKTNVALAQVLAGLALLFLDTARERSWRWWAGVGVSMFILALASLTLVEHLLGWNLGIDQLLASEPPGAMGVTSPNRMGVPAAGSLILLGLGLLFLALQRKTIASYLAIVVCVINLVPAVGYLYGISQFYETANLTAIAWPTVVALLSLGLGLIFACADSAPISVLLRDDPGGALLRRMLPVVVLVPLALGFLREIGQYTGFYSTATGTGLLVIALILVFSAMLWLSASGLSRSSEEIGRSRVLLAEAEKLSHTGAWQWDLITNQWTFSDEWLAIHGCVKRTLTPDELLNIGYIDDRDAIASALEDVRNGIRPYDIEHRIVRQDTGDIRTIRARGNFVRDAQGKVVRVYGFAQDITEQKRAEEALRESEAQLRTVLENTTEGVVVSTLEGRLIHWNRAALQMHGYASLEECIRLLPEFADTLELLELDGTPVPLENWPMVRVLRGEQLRDWEVRVKRLDQAWERIFSYGGSIIHDSEGRPFLALLTIANITERKQAEEQVRRFNAELEQRVNERTAELQASNRELQTLSYSIMHDLRTPLRAIGGFSDALIKHYSHGIDDKGQDYLRRIGAAAQKMSRIIDDIHDLLRATRAEVHRQEVDMSAIVRELFSQLKNAQPEREAKTIVEPGIMVNADPALLRAAIGHLIGNAWKFSSSREVSCIEVAAIEQNGERVYVVRDNGVGFNPAYADKLFTPFQRLHSESDFPGTGIGLALVERILHRHGGRVWAESEPGRGAAFYFTLGEANK